MKCMGTTQKAERCKLGGTPRTGGWVGCGHHPRRPTPPPEADGDGEHVNEANDHLVQAMRHELWSQVPGPIRHLIENAWVALDRATTAEP